MQYQGRKYLEMTKKKYFNCVDRDFLQIISQLTVATVKDKTLNSFES